MRLQRARSRVPSAHRKATTACENVPQITFIQPDGSAATLNIATGSSVMEGARAGGIPGIEAICGGMCSCATCHCYVDARWQSCLPRMEDDEAALLDFAWERRASSRLSCQLTVSEAMDGLVLEVPARQE